MQDGLFNIDTPARIDSPERRTIAGAYYTDGGNYFLDHKDGPIQLTNFTARISAEATYHDDRKKTTHLTIDGNLADGTVLPTVSMPATDFGTMNWIAELWGSRPIIYPHGNAERHLRTIMQTDSTPEKRHVYTHTGWQGLQTDEGEVEAYLTNGAAITAEGYVPAIDLRLPKELENFRLPAPEIDADNAIASLRLVNLGPKPITWALLLATYRAAMGPTDFALHLAGRTGTFKSELSSLFQSHFGDKMDARHLPASWSSTANALECLAYKAKDALFVVDDFIPVGTSWSVRTLQAKADQFIRGQGNQAGRSRLTDTSQMQSTFYPRGIVLSTGEDVPEGHSIRARMLIAELSPGDITAEKLTAAQQQRPRYPKALADWIHWLAQQPDRRDITNEANAIRDTAHGIGHARTAPIVGQLTATGNQLAQWLQERGYITADVANDLKTKLAAAIRTLATIQATYLETADPVCALCSVIRTLLTSCHAHLKTKNGGIPADPTRYGWTEQQVPGEVPTFKSNGPRIGWLDHDAGELLLNPDAIVLIKKFSGGKLAITTQTLQKRLKDADMLTRTDVARQRNTVRITAEGHPHNVLAMPVAKVMEDDGE